MQQTKQMIANGDVRVWGDFEIALDDSEKGTFKITLPLYHDFLFSLVNEKGEGVPISSLMVSDSKSIIQMPRANSSWKLKIMKAPTPSSKVKDETGDPVSVSDDESGDNPKGENADRSIDWLSEQLVNMNERFEEVAQNSSQEILIQNEIS